jgi:tRNA threonylcarbamoyladenosine biosynthesis protein TsaB
MTILAIETSAGPCSVAIGRRGQLLCSLHEPRQSAQSTRLMPLIEQALAEAGLGYGDIRAVAASVGPGSFTGIRTGLSAARGICLAAGLPGLGFGTLEALAYPHRNAGKPVLAVLNAGKGEVYSQLFAAHPRWQALGAPQVGTLEAALAMAGEGALYVGNVPAVLAAMPHAEALLALAADEACAPLPLSPVYIRPPDAKPMAVDRPAGTGV